MWTNRHTGMPISIYCAASVAKVINVLNYMYVGYLTCCVLYELTVNSYSTSMYLVGCWRYRAFSPPGQFAPRSESVNRTLANSLPGPFAPGQFAPWPFPGSEWAWERKGCESLLTTAVFTIVLSHSLPNYKLIDGSETWPQSTSI